MYAHVYPRGTPDTRTLEPGVWNLESGVWGLKIFSTLTSTTRLSAYPRSFASSDLLGFGPSGYFTGWLVAVAYDLSRARVDAAT